MSSHIMENESSTNAQKDSFNSKEVSQDVKMYSSIHCCFRKSILVEGKGFTKPLLESQCSLGCFESQQEVDCDSEEVVNKLQEVKDIIIGMSQDLHSLGLETMLMTMQQGETSYFHVWWKTTPALVTCDKQEVDCMEKEQHIILNLYSFTEATPIWHLGSEEKYELSLSHKNKGTSLFQEDKAEAAFYQFGIALKYLISILHNKELSSEEDKSKYEKLKCICYLNMAACQIKYDNFDNVIENCSKGLNLEPWNVKGLYRRALAYKGKGDIDKARSDLIKIVKREPRNKMAADLLESLMPSNLPISST